MLDDGVFKSASSERCVRVFENARIGQGRVITELAMWPLLAKPCNVVESELKAMLRGLIGELLVYQLPPQTTSNLEPKMMLSDSTRDQRRLRLLRRSLEKPSVLKRGRKKRQLRRRRIAHSTVVTVTPRFRPHVGVTGIKLDV